MPPIDAASATGSCSGRWSRANRPRIRPRRSRTTRDRHLSLSLFRSFFLSLSLSLSLSLPFLTSGSFLGLVCSRVRRREDTSPPGADIIEGSHVNAKIVSRG